ncbi:hypothetical protein CLV92_107164 [Kineococcus xinjiangensis]|uniref:Uncharacterized protein n=1 Tax=Kineococcus xinjiangensis TaxID=512762 RepID=A0A2S6IKF6_9ACTN|nr:hypothetical protein [Kineococcus xinjiangensis]PPK94661.1 hypothetical protein CLV92_107164 [Kineococcus xinjiangensis]
MPYQLWWLLLLLALPLFWHGLGLVSRWLDHAAGVEAPPPRHAVTRAPAELEPAPAAPPTTAWIVEAGLPPQVVDAAGVVAANLLQVEERLAAGGAAAEHEHRLDVLRSALKDVCRELADIPADLRERPGGPEGTTPTQEAMAVLTRLQEGAEALRVDVFDDAAERLRVLRRYTDDTFERSDLDLDR